MNDSQSHASPSPGSSTEGRETRAFRLHWSNDYDLYHAVLGHARDLLRSEPELTDAALGLNVVRTVQGWCKAASDPDSLLALMRREVGNFDAVDPASVGEDVREGLG